MIDFILSWIVLPMLFVGVVLAVIRLLAGPTLPSRVVALDMMAVLGIGIITVYSIVSEQPVLIDVAAVLALVSFLGTVAFAAYVERRS